MFLLNPYAPSCYGVIAHQTKSFSKNTFYLFHNVVILSFYVLQHKIRVFSSTLYAHEGKIYTKGANS